MDIEAFKRTLARDEPPELSHALRAVHGPDSSRLHQISTIRKRSFSILIPSSSQRSGFILSRESRAR